MPCTCCDDDLLRSTRWIFKGARTRRYNLDLDQVIWMDAGGIRPSQAAGQLLLRSNVDATVRVYDETTLALLETSTPEPLPLPLSGLFPRVLEGSLAITMDYAIDALADRLIKMQRTAPGIWVTLDMLESTDLPLPDGLLSARPLDIVGTVDDYYVLWAGIASGPGAPTLDAPQYLLSRHVADHTTDPDASLDPTWLQTIHTPEQGAIAPAFAFYAQVGKLSIAADGVYATVRQRLVRVSDAGDVEFDLPLNAIPWTLTASGEHIYLVTAEYPEAWISDPVQAGEVVPEEDPGPHYWYRLRLFSAEGEPIRSRIIPDRLSIAAHHHVTAGSDSTLWLTSIAASPPPPSGIFDA